MVIFRGMVYEIDLPTWILLCMRCFLLIAGILQDHPVHGSHRPADPISDTSSTQCSRDCNRKDALRCPFSLLVYHGIRLGCKGSKVTTMGILLSTWKFGATDSLVHSVVNHPILGCFICTVSVDIPTSCSIAPGMSKEITKDGIRWVSGRSSSNRKKKRETQ